MSHKNKLKVLGVVRIFVLVFFFLLVVLPIYWILITSLKTPQEVLDFNNITYIPQQVTTENYTGLFELYDYAELLGNSLIVSITTALAVTIISIFGGYALARFKFKSKKMVIVFFLITQMIPGILVIIPMYLAFSSIGIINTHLGLFIFYMATNLPFCLITMRSFFERIPVTLEEAARVDGCSMMGGIYRIILPVMFPGIVAVGVFAFIGAWNELIAGTVFISTPDMWTIPVGLRSLIGKYNVEWGLLMAGGIMALLPTAIMFAAMQKFIVEGMTAGAVKE